MTDPNALERLITQGKVTVQEGNLERGIAIFSTVIEADPYHAEAYLMRGAAYARISEMRRALPDLNRAIELGGENFIAAYQQRSLVHKAMGHEDEYKTDLRHVVTSRADYAGKHGDWEYAFQLYEQYLTSVPDDIDILNIRAMLYFQQGNYSGALDDYNHILALKPNDGETYANRSAVQLIMDKLALALIDINRAIQLNADSAMAYRHRAHIHLLLGDLKSALADANQAVKLEPRNAGAYHIRAEVHYALDLINRAMADIRRYEVLSGDTEAFTEIKMALSQHLPAQVDAETAGKVEALQQEAQNALKEDQGRKAERAIQQAIKLAPQYAPLQVVLGDIYRHQEQYAEAQLTYEQAIAMNPRSVDAYYGRAMVYLNRKNRDPQAAVRDLNTCLELNPKNLIYYRLRGMANSYSPRSEDRHEAIEDFKAYLMKGGGREYGDGHQVQQLINDLQRALNNDGWQG